MRLLKILFFGFCVSAFTVQSPAFEPPGTTHSSEIRSRSVPFAILISERLGRSPLRDRLINFAGLVKIRTGSDTAEERPEWLDRIVVSANDPFGSLNHLLEQALGIGAEDRMKCSFFYRKKTGPEIVNDRKKLPGEGRTGTAIGMQIRFDW